MVGIQRATPVNATGHSSPEPRMNAAIAADWRRRVRAYQTPPPPPDDDGEGRSRSQITTDLAERGSRDAMTRDFAESQRAGLAAMIRLATAETASGPLAPAEPYEPQAEPSASPSGLAASAAPARSLPDIPVTVLDRPVIPAPHIPTPSGGPSSAGAEAHLGRRRAGRGQRLSHIPGLLLVVILTVQALLSLRLVWSNTAFLDEATYLYGGHVEIEHWLHGTPVPPFATYFSGAPVIYPPLAALAASGGGLAAARMLSLAFMLGVTGLLWGTTSKLFGERAAFFAAVLFAVLGPTQVLGAFATYDAMALFLLAASVWCIVYAQNRDDSTLLLVAGTLLLALANATKYATALYDPTIIALATLTVTGNRGLKPALARGGYIAAGTLGLLSALLALGGPWYLTGVFSTTLSRATGNKSAFLVLADSWKWIGLVCLIGLLGLVCALRRHNRVQTIILTILIVSGTLVPLDQARIHTTTSLFKQVDFGAWFAAAAAGFAFAQLCGTGRRIWLRVCAFSFAGTLVVAFVGIIGRAQASVFFQEWPDSAQETALIDSLIQSHPGNYLAEDYNIPAYYLENSIPWQRWSKTWYFSYTPPDTHRVVSGASAYQEAIDNGYFSLVILDFTDTARIDSQIVADLRQAGTYELVADVPTHDKLGSGQVLVWAYAPASLFREEHRGDH